MARVCSCLLPFMWATWCVTAAILVLLTMCETLCCSLPWKQSEYVTGRLFFSLGGGFTLLQRIWNPNRLPLTSWPTMDFSQSPDGSLKAPLFPSHHQRWTGEERTKAKDSLTSLSLPQRPVLPYEIGDLFSQWLAWPLGFLKPSVLGSGGITRGKQQHCVCRHKGSALNHITTQAFDGKPFVHLCNYF